MCARAKNRQAEVERTTLFASRIRLGAHTCGPNFRAHTIPCLSFVCGNFLYSQCIKFINWQIQNKYTGKVLSLRDLGLWIFGLTHRKNTYARHKHALRMTWSLCVRFWRQHRHYIKLEAIKLGVCLYMLLWYTPAIPCTTSRPNECRLNLIVFGCYKSILNQLNWIYIDIERKGKQEEGKNNRTYDASYHKNKIRV